MEDEDEDEEDDWDGEERSSAGGQRESTPAADTEGATSGDDSGDGAVDGESMRADAAVDGSRVAVLIEADEGFMSDIARLLIDRKSVV